MTNKFSIPISLTTNKFSIPISPEINALLDKARSTAETAALAKSALEEAVKRASPYHPGDILKSSSGTLAYVWEIYGVLEPFSIPPRIGLHCLKIKNGTPSATAIYLLTDEWKDPVIHQYAPRPEPDAGS